MEKRTAQKAKQFLPSKVEVSPEGEIRIVAGLYLPSRANQSHAHRMVQSRHAKSHRFLGCSLVSNALLRVSRQTTIYPKWQVMLTRFAPRLLDSDNNVCAFKSIRDGVADALLIDDRDEGRLQFRYGQEKSPAYGIRIVLENHE